jgi:hypothetical protein
MRIHRPRRRWYVVVVVAVLAIASIRALDGASMIYYYRVVDDQTLAVGTVTGHGAWTRVTGLTETPTTITITVDSLLFQPGAGTSVGVPVESEVTLHDPIGDRSVIDGSSGRSVRRALCLPPSYFSSPCP